MGKGLEIVSFVALDRHILFGSAVQLRTTESLNEKYVENTISQWSLLAN